MADVKFSALATATTSIGTTIAVVEGGISKKIVVASAFDYLLTNDGNGGQPPAPKPKAYVAGGTPGEVVAAQVNGGSTWTNPGGTWNIMRIDCVAATGLISGVQNVIISANITVAIGYITYMLGVRIS